MRIAGLLLAAGRGARMGRPKLAEQRVGRTLAEHALAPLLGLGLERIVVVAPPAPPMAEILPDLSGVRVCINPSPETGLSGSLRLGLEAMAPEVEAVLVALADMPSVSPGTCAGLIGAWREGLTAAAPVHAGRRGNPVLVETQWARRIASGLSGDRGLGAALDQLTDTLLRLEVNDPGVLFDVDTEADLARWRASSP